MKTLNTNDLKKKVYVLRNVQVMLDFDLAEIYGYEVRALNQQVKRNITRFPEDFMFQLTKKDIDFIKSQFVILPNKALFSDDEGGNRKLLYAFTEQGIYMLATVLKGKLAEQQSIYIMRAFKEMKHYIYENMQFVTKNEKVYHSGASSKDAGNKVCSINLIEKSELIYPVVDKLILNQDIIL